MKIAIIQLLTIITLIGCAKETTSPSEEKTPVKNSIEGTWKLVYADIKENDSIQVKDLSNTEKLCNETKDAATALSAKLQNNDKMWWRGAILSNS